MRVFSDNRPAEKLSAFPIVCRASEPTAVTTSVVWITPGCKGAARAFFINDNLAWTIHGQICASEPTTRIFRLNDYDFGEGTFHSFTYTTLANSVSARLQPHPDLSARELPPTLPELDLYAQDTWK